MPDASPDGGDEDRLRTTVPHSARVWNYWLGGKDNYQADRAAGDAVTAVYPEIRVAARESRQFLIRVVTHLAETAGIRQFLDIGTGLPTMQNTHEIAQQVAPDARVVYVDNDPLVLAHARALLVDAAPEGRTAYVDADLHDPEAILAAARDTLDFTEPIAVMLFGILGHIADDDEALRIVGRLMAAVPPGSYLAAEDSTSTGAEVRAGAEKYAEAGAIPYNLRDAAQIARYFDGLELVSPGVVPVTQWAAGAHAPVDAPHIDKYGGVARKP